MIFFYYGKNERESLQVAQAKRSELLNIYKNAACVVSYADDFSFPRWKDALFSDNLFEDPIVVYGNKVSLHKEGRQFLDMYYAEMATSNSIFILVEPSNADPLLCKKLCAAANECFESRLPGTTQPQHNKKLFFLADALGDRDKRLLWKGIVGALRGGSTAEEIHALLLWQVRTMALVRAAQNAKEENMFDRYGVKFFVAKKAKRFLNNYKDDDLVALMDKLITLPQRARSTSTPLSLLLEQFALNL